VQSATLDFLFLVETTDSQQKSTLLQPDCSEGKVKKSFMANRKQDYGHPPVPTTLPTAGLAVELSLEKEMPCVK